MKYNIKLNASGVEAFGLYDTETEEVLIKKGSMIKNDTSPSLHDSYLVQRQALLENREVIQELKFVKNYQFTSLSAASSIITGSPCSGPKTFKLDNGKEVSTILNDSIIKYINENVDKYASAVKNFKSERKSFIKDYPLEKIKELDLEDYDQLAKSDSFMNMLEKKTPSLGGRSFGYNYNKLFFQKASDKKYDIYSAIKNNPKYKNMEIHDIFNIYKKELYDYIKTFDINNYDSLSDYPAKEFIASAHIMKMKLIQMYLDVKITSCNALNMIRRLLEYLEIPYNYEEDSVSLNIKLTNYIFENDPDLKTKYPMCQINQCIWSYYNKYVNTDKNYYVVQLYDKTQESSYFDDNIFTIGWKNVDDFREYNSDDEIVNKKLTADKSNDLKATKSILSCFKKLKAGDRLLLKETNNNNDETKIIAIGEVLEGYDQSYAFDDKIGHIISVEWTSLEEPFIIENKLKDCIISKFNNRKLINNIEYKITNGNCTESGKDIIGQNIIYYGVPGCGKSRLANDEAEKNGNVERIIFHPDYSYADFVGQILPVLKDGKPEYKFVAGDFTKILGAALSNPDQHFYLIIDEINRGNASAIFGDVFQLLDRLKEDRKGFKKGDSEYSIQNANISQYLKDIGLDNTEVYIPSNLSIVATMNSSDQNVFPLDTAFKRRWIFKKVSNIFDDNHPYKDDFVAKSKVTWQTFVDILNNKIATLNEYGINGDDKQIGKYFLSKEEIKDIDLIADKLLLYLWEDVVKFNRSLLFPSNYKTLDELIASFKGDPTNPFVVFGELFNDKNN